MAAPRVALRTFLSSPVHWLALGFGSGLSPRAPGTAGTLMALVLHWGLLLLPWSVHVALVIIACVAGFWICGASARRLGVHDHPAIVWDEIAPFLGLLLLLPQEPLWWAGAFVVFRVFDILKPWPIRDVDHSIHGGLGIMLDDILAAFYALLVLWGVKLLLA